MSPVPMAVMTAIRCNPLSQFDTAVLALRIPSILNKFFTARMAENARRKSEHVNETSGSRSEVRLVYLIVYSYYGGGVNYGLS